MVLSRDCTGYGELFDDSPFALIEDYIAEIRTEMNLTEKYIIYIETIREKVDMYEWLPVYINVYRVNLDGGNNTEWHYETRYTEWSSINYIINY